jgi:autotransporter-associated beta strand protein
VNGIISSTNTLTLNLAGGGAFQFSGANTYTGATTISAGTLSASNVVVSGGNSNLGNASSAVILGDASNQGTLNYTGAAATYTRGFTISAGGGQLTNAGSGLLTVATGGISAGGLFTVGGATGKDIAISSVISSTGGLTKTGADVLTLTGANTYSGATTINASGGTLKIDNNNNTTARLASTSGITVNSGGTLLLAQSGGTASNDRINNAATMKLNGGTFNTGGLSEHGASNNTAGIGALTLQSSSIIDMGSGASIVAFANSSSASWSGTLSIYNWSGTPYTGGGTDQLYFGNDATGLTGTQLGEIQFYSDSGTTLYGGLVTILSTGEVVAVPEPSTWIGGALTLGAIGFMQRRRLGKLLKRAA